ncbi:PREDICTED: uncharacterized protein LOC109222364 [Nicotiana attenuata]|uniref:Transmembrane protein n=1 Tax=Nicotiana attenuata TaxID=49451 RepID=A0A1J6JB95_NICAT|nr:PREDICTED: uncharacterized protein LOC109222364 [Nicotiana attenuata]OIT06975.1 hypothetical protein A4A49_12836 [Nicotiana attenuata]
MGSSSQICHQEEKKTISFFDYVANMLKESFQCLTIILLSLLLPLSFIVLARLSVARYLITTSTEYYTRPDSLLVKIFLYANPNILHVLVPLVAVSALIHGLTGRTILFIKQSADHMTYSKPCLYTAWFFLFMLQICVCIGVEGSIAIGIGGSSSFSHHERLCLLSRVIFFFGLHETTSFWAKKVVKPVVDDTVFGVKTADDRMVEKVAMAMSFGVLWWWKLRDEVESLVVVAEMKRELIGSVDLVDFVGWWLYYMTLAIGMVKIVKGFIWVCFVMFCGNVVHLENADYSTRNDDKV